MPRSRDSSSSSEGSRYRDLKHEQRRRSPSPRSQPQTSRSSRRSPSPHRRRPSPGRQRSGGRPPPRRQTPPRRGNPPAPRRRSGSPHGRRRSPPRRSSPHRQRSHSPRRPSPRRRRSPSPQRPSSRRQRSASPRRSGPPSNTAPPRREPSKETKRSRSPRDEHRVDHSSTERRRSLPEPARPSERHREDGQGEPGGRIPRPRERTAQRPVVREAESTVKDTTKRSHESEPPVVGPKRHRGFSHEEQKLHVDLEVSAERRQQAMEDAVAHSFSHEHQSERTHNAEHSRRDSHRSRSPVHDHGDKDERMRSRRTYPPPAYKSTEPEVRRSQRYSEADRPSSTRGSSDVQEKTKSALSDRFGGPTREKPFVPQENITVGIERNIKGRSTPVIRRDFVAEEVVVVRRKEEGAKPFFRREEFMGQREDYVERRVVKVVRSDGEDSRSVSRYEDDFQHKENFEVRRDRFEAGDLAGTRPSLSDRWRESTRDSGRTGSVYSPGERREVVRREGDFERYKDISSYRSPDPLRHGDRDERLVSDRSRLHEDVRNISTGLLHGDRDERLVSDTGRRYTISTGQEDFRRDEDLRVRSRERYERDPNDLRHNLARRRYSERDDMDARQRISERRQDTDFRRQGAKGVDTDFRRPGDTRFQKKESVPDFSRRPDKYKYEEWKDKPEMIPKGVSYYEHDNRGQEDFQSDFGFRGRGRGRWRGRGNWYYRGRGRGAPYRRSQSDIGEWKHDKFQEVEEDQDNKPTSTTEK